LKVVFTALGIHDVVLTKFVRLLGIEVPPVAAAVATVWIWGTGINRGWDALKDGASAIGAGFAADPIAALLGNDRSSKGGTGTFAPSIVVPAGVVLGLTT
jgi:hypothetical protein